jgi:phosphatidylglycerol:prolipoprotein diacylglycerol transferase
MQITQPVLHLGPLTVTLFGLIVALNVVISGIVTAWFVRRRGEDPILVFDLLGWMLVLGVVLARLFYVLNPPPSVAALYSREWYLAHLLDLQIGPLAVWSGGLSMAGMLVGVVLGALVVIRRHQLDGWLWADIAVPGLLLLQIIGPWGNLLMGQMIGPPTTMPWGVVIDHPPPPYNDTLSYPPGTLFHPTPAYLSLWALLVSVGVGGLNKRCATHFQYGDTFLGVSLLYCVGLFLTDFLRVDVSRILLGLSGMQIVALVMFAWSIAMILGHRRRADSKHATYSDEH